MNPVDLVLQRVKGAKKSGAGWMAPCPAHADGKPSLHISIGTDGKALLKCHAGCPTEAVVDALGITMTDLFQPKEEPIRRQRKAQPGNGGPRTVTKYEIRDASGNVVAVHGREDRPGEEKEMWWELPSGKTGLGGIPNNELPLYGIDRLPREGPVVVVEGEKAADALISNGIAAVGTVTGAASTPGDDALRPLLPHPVLLWPDNDDMGRQHMGKIAEALIRLHHRDVRFVTWKGAPEKGDAADLVTLEGWRDDYDALVADAVKIKTKEPLFQSLAELLANPRPQTWLVHGLIETPSTNLFFGPSGAGKSFVAVDLSGATATDGSWMGKAVSGGITFYVAGEGRVGLLRRFQAWQLKRKKTIPKDRLYLSAMSVKFDEAGARQVEEEIGRIARENGASPALIIVDTLARTLPSGADENSAKDVGAFVNIVDRIRDKFECVVVVIHHTGHSEKERARGSSALKAAMDSELLIKRQGATRLVEFTKLKDLPEQPHPQEFALEGELLGKDEVTGKFITSAVVEWKGRAERKDITTPTKAESLGLETLRAAIAAAGGPVQIDAWRFVFNGKHWGENNESKRKAFNRVRESLAGKHLIKIDDGKYSIPTYRDSGT